MPDFERVDQINQLAHLLGSMPFGDKRIPIPKPVLARWATELHDKFGVRVHPDLASMELVPDPEADASMPGIQSARMQPVNGGSRRVVPRVDAAALLNMLRDVGDKQGVPSLSALADRIEAAETDEQRKLVIDDIGRENPGLISTFQRHMDSDDAARIFGQ